MSELPVGVMGWLDITVEDAAGLRDFYTDVVGWTASGVSMQDGAYEDYAMVNAKGEGVAGVCWKRGSNANIPTAWIPYFTVGDLDASVERAVARGATILDDRRGGDSHQFVVMKDPAGAVMALFGV